MRTLFIVTAALILAVTAACGTQQTPTTIVKVVTATSEPAIQAPPTGTPAPVLEPTATQTILAPTATAASGASDLPPILWVTSNIVCRTGPGTGFKQADILTPEKVIPILGKYTDPTTGLWYVVSPSGARCYVNAADTSQAGNVDGVPKITNPPRAPTSP